MKVLLLLNIEQNGIIMMSKKKKKRGFCLKTADLYHEYHENLFKYHKGGIQLFFIICAVGNLLLLLFEQPMVQFPRLLFWYRLAISAYLIAAATAVFFISNHKLFFTIVSIGEILAVKVALLVAITHKHPNMLVQAMGITTLSSIIFILPNVWKTKFAIAALLYVSFFGSTILFTSRFTSPAFLPSFIFTTFMNLILGIYSYNVDDYQKYSFVLKEQAVRISYTDFLTGIKNRGYLYEEGSKVIELCRRKNAPYSVVFFDVNRMKFINDNYGHEQGDVVLKLFSNIVSASIRSNDIFVRLGGDEFALLLPFTNIAEAKALIERLQAQIEEKLNVCGHAITCSIGVASSNGSAALSDILQEADKNMYIHKEEHRREVYDTQTPNSAPQENCNISHGT